MPKVQKNPPQKPKKTNSTSPLISQTKNDRSMILSKCAVCNTKKSRFIKKQDPKGLLSNLGIRTPLSKIPRLGDVLF